MIRLVSLAALAVAIASPAFAFDIKANVGIGQLASQSTGQCRQRRRRRRWQASAHQDAASVGSAGAQLQVKPSGVTVLTSAEQQHQRQPVFAFGLNAGLSFGGTQNASAGSWAGLAGALKF